MIIIKNIISIIIKRKMFDNFNVKLKIIIEKD